jgi:N-acetylmuramoyl-L-alanine amidase
LHNNAAGNGSQWMNARGIAVYTSKGVTKSDVCADFIIEKFKKDFPEFKVRMYKPTNLEKDFEENFTVLMGNGYMGVLIEWLFQDNKEDVKELQSHRTNKRFEDSLVEAIESINDYFGKDEK